MLIEIALLLVSPSTNFEWLKQSSKSPSSLVIAPCSPCMNQCFIACCWRSELVRVVLLTETSSTCISVDALRRTQYRTLVGSLEDAVLCCALFTMPYHSNDGAVLFDACVAMGMLLHSNVHLQISTVADRLSMFATCGKILWNWCVGRCCGCGCGGSRLEVSKVSKHIWHLERS
jgi:hypothetical protein